MKFKSITAHEVFENVQPARIFSLYTNADMHANATGAPALITDLLGEPFNLYGGFCFGENIEIKKDKLIIQTWRTNDWPDSADDSIVIIRLIPFRNDTHLYLTHADIPISLAESLKKGWQDFYWSKWRSYLKQ